MSIVHLPVSSSFDSLFKSNKLAGHSVHVLTQFDLKANLFSFTDSIMIKPEDKLDYKLGSKEVTYRGDLCG